MLLVVLSKAISKVPSKKITKIWKLASEIYLGSHTFDIATAVYDRYAVTRFLIFSNSKKKYYRIKNLTSFLLPRNKNIEDKIKDIPNVQNL